MKKINDIATKIFNLKWYWQFIMWFVFMFGIFILGFRYLFHDKPPMVLIQMGCAISLIMSLMATMMNSGMKRSQKYYDKIREFESAVTKATSSEELITIREVLIDYARCNSSHEVQHTAANKVITIIDTRLKYEFKL